MIDLSLLISELSLSLFLKIGVGAILLLYTVFTFMVFIQVKSLNMILQIKGSSASTIVMFLSILQILVGLSLFVLAIAIL